MSSKCIFCNIINKTAFADILFEDGDLIIFKDIKPAAKNHVLVVPKLHIKDAKALTIQDKPLLDKLIAAGNRLFERMGLDLQDIRMGFHWPPFNSISHLHLHCISPASEMSLISRAVFKPNTMWFVSIDYMLKRMSTTDSHL